MFRPLLTLCAACLLLGAVPAFAETVSETTAHDAPSGLRADYSNIHQATLDNGLDVIIVENHITPIVTIEIAAHNGAFAETKELNGLSHLYEHMFFKANAVYENQEAFMQRQQELGMVWNGTTGDERVNYFFTLPASLTDEGLAFMAAAIRTPRFDKQELDREKEVVLGEYDRAQANPYWYLWRATDNMLWYKHAHRKNPIGTREAIQKASVKKMTRMQQDFYVPNNCLLVLSGDITKEEGLALAQKHLGDWKQGADPFIKNPIPEHPPLKKNAADIVTQNIGVSVIQMAWQGPDTRTSVQDTYAADVFSYALSQASSQLQKDLVDSGIALGANLSYQTEKYKGPITFTVTVIPGNEEAAIQAMNNAIDAFSDEHYVSDKLLQTAKTVLSVDDLSLQQSTISLTHTLSYWWASATVDYYLNYIANLNAVTHQDMQRYVQQWIQDKPRTIVLLSHQDVTKAWTKKRLLQLLDQEVTP